MTVLCHADDEVDPVDARAGLGTWGPVVLWRRGTLAVGHLRELLWSGTWLLVDDLLDARACRARLADQLERTLHDCVPQVPADSRRLVLRLRRDVHNDRPIDPEAGQIPGLPSSAAAALGAWAEAKAHEVGLSEHAAEVLRHERVRTRQALARLAQEECFAQGLQLSGQSLYQDVEDYCAAIGEGRPLDRRHRHTERTLASFACRVALKPSPFGGFTVIGAQPWQAGADGSQPPATAAQTLVSRAQINLGLLDWMASEVAGLAGAEHCLVLRLNDTARVDGQTVRFFTRGRPGTEEQFGGERFVSMPLSRPVAALIEALGGRSPSQAEVVERLCSGGASPAVVGRFVDQLVEAGLCLRDLAVEDQARHRAARMASALAVAPAGSPARAASTVFDRLHDVELRFPHAERGERSALLDAVAGQVARFGALCGNEKAAIEFARSQVFEDLGSPAPARSFDADALESNRAAFTVFQELLVLLDDSVFERFGMATWFKHRYGPRATVPVLDLYRAFSDLTTSEKSAVMRAADDALCDELRARRRGLLDGIAAQLEGNGDADRIELDLEWMRAQARRIPDAARLPTEVAYRLQLCEDLRPGRVVLNGATTGRGVYYSRFCELLEPEGGGWSLTQAVRDDIRRSWPNQADLMAVLAMNVNLHPRLAPAEILYPGAVGRRVGEPAHALVDLSVRCRPDQPVVLELVSGSDGSTLDLVPHNFLFPAAAPMLYRFLCTFAPTWTYRRGLWDRIGRAATAAGRRYFPRLVLTDVVLERRCWRVPARQVAELSGTENVESLVAARRWRVASGLPDESFFRLDTEQVPTGDADWIGLTRAWALEARSARLRKPHYLDLRSPVLVDILQRQARALPDATVVFQECLPSSSTYGDGRADRGGLAAAEELIVQFRTGGSP